jgi:hypothetical protein
MTTPKKNNHTPVIIWLLLALLAIAGCQKMNPVHPQAGIHWYNLADGRAEATRLKLPSLVDFYYGPECPRCSAFAKNIYSDPSIIHRLNTQFIPIRIYLGKALTPDEQALADTMKINGECMLMFLNSTGRIVKARSGGPICTMSTITSKQFSSYLDQALSNLHK